MVGKAKTDWFAVSSGTFGNLFANAVSDKSQSIANQQTTQSSSNPLEQLTELLQNGTSLSTIVDTIAQSVGGSVAHQLSGKLTQSQVAGVRSSIIQSITNALSPPANAPPGTAAQEAAALAARLQSLISAIARETPATTAGQQNDISGHVLDANSAKELPAQQKTNDASTPVDVSSLVRSLLANVVAALSATASNASSSRPAGSGTPQGAKTNAVARPSTNVATAIAAAAAAPQTPSPVAYTRSGDAPPATTTAPAPVSAPITMANAPDLLARMLVRAASADPTVSGTAEAATQPSPQGSGGTPITAAALAARFASTIAGVMAGNASSSGGQSAGGWANRSFTGGQPNAPSPSANASAAAVPGTPVTQSQNLSQPQQVQGGGVDVNSVIEQMVKSMTMRTSVTGASEIRLNLQPENLGTVTMHLTVSGSQISANVIAQNADVRGALLANHQQLARSLSNAGLTLTSFSVDVSGGDAKQQQQNQGQAGLGRRYTVHELNGDAASNEAATNTALGPPLNGGSSVGLFNYLA